MALISKPINLSTEANLLYEIYKTLKKINIASGSSGSQNLAQTLFIDNKTNNIPIVSNNEMATVDVNDAYTALGYDTQSFVMTNYNVQLYSYVPVAFESTVSIDLNTPVLRHNGAEVATKNWVTSQGYGTLPYQELIFTAVQTAPQTGITSGTLIEGGRYTIFDTGTADFTISGAPNNDIGTVFVANSTPPDWGDFGTLDFEGNPIVTILNNPLSDTYTSGYTDIGSYYLEGLLDFPANTFPKLGNLVDVIQQTAEDFSVIGQKQYLWYKNPSNDKQIIFRSGASGGLTDDVLDGLQLFIVKIFNP